MHRDALLKSYSLMLFVFCCSLGAFASETKSSLQASQKESKLNKNSKGDEFADLGEYLKIYLKSLPESEKEKVPEAYRSSLLWFGERMDKSPISVGGWHIESSKPSLELTRWHIVSNYLRVAVKISALKSEDKWVFKDLRFLQAKTKPAK